MEVDDPAYIYEEGPSFECHEADNESRANQLYSSSEKVNTNKAVVPQENELIPSTSSASVSTNLLLEPIVPPTPRGIIPTLHNIVCTVDLGCRLDLTKIALRVKNAEYNPKRFHAVVMRLWSPRTACLVFGSGKLVVTGAKSESDAHLAARKYARIIQKTGFQVKFIDFKIQNMVGSCDVRFPIMLERLYINHVQFCSYEPELFPGLIYRMISPKVSLLIFVSGKLVLTGAKDREQLNSAFENIYPVLRACRKQR